LAASTAAFDSSAAALPVDADETSVPVDRS